MHVKESASASARACGRSICIDRCAPGHFACTVLQSMEDASNEERKKAQSLFEVMLRFCVHTTQLDKTAHVVLVSDSPYSEDTLNKYPELRGRMRVIKMEDVPEDTATLYLQDAIKRANKGPSTSNVPPSGPSDPPGPPGPSGPSISTKSDGDAPGTITPTAVSPLSMWTIVTQVLLTTTRLGRVVVGMDEDGSGKTESGVPTGDTASNEVTLSEGQGTGGKIRGRTQQTS
jgi:hypothetical protein